MCDHLSTYGHVGEAYLKNSLENETWTHHFEPETKRSGTKQPVQEAVHSRLRDQQKKTIFFPRVYKTKYIEEQ